MSRRSPPGSLRPTLLVALSLGWGCGTGGELGAVDAGEAGDGVDGSASGTDAAVTPDAAGASDAPATLPPIRPYDGCAADGPEARAVDETPPPATMTASTPATVSLTFANCGDTAWAAAPALSGLGVKLGSQAPENNESWGLGRVLLPGDVPPSHQVTLSFEIVAPPDNGSHAYRWQIVDELVRWIDAPSALRTIEVTGGRDVPATVFHPRSEWESPDQPVTGPALDLLALRYITIHYPGGSVDVDGSDDIYQDEDTARFLRNTQASYLSGRGYSLGYNSAVSIDGAEWEIRGDTIRSAANGCTAVNVPGYAIQIVVPEVASMPTPAAIEGVRSVVARIRRLAAEAGNTDHLELNGHRDVRPMCGTGGTACPGEPIYSLIASGAFEP